MRLRRLLAVASIAVATACAPASLVSADSGQWAGPGTERDYCEGLLEWHRAHPAEPVIDGWPAYCATTYPDLVAATSTSTSTISSSVPVPAAGVVAGPVVAVVPGFTG